MPIIETDFSEPILQRLERRIQLVLPNFDQPNQARIGGCCPETNLHRVVTTGGEQRSGTYPMPSNRVEHDRVNVAQGGFTSSGYNHEEQRTTEWLTPNDDGLMR